MFIQTRPAANHAEAPMNCLFGVSQTARAAVFSSLGLKAGK
jgi:hypothetical protein